MELRKWKIRKGPTFSFEGLDSVVCCIITCCDGLLFQGSPSLLSVNEDGYLLRLHGLMKNDGA